MADDKKKYTGDDDIDECIQMALDVMAPKNKDYSESHGNGDRLYNFKSVADDLGLSKEMVLYVYLWKHLQAVKRYCREGKVDSEGIKGRIVDCINYLEILYKMVCENERAERPQEPEEPAGLRLPDLDEEFWRKVQEEAEKMRLPKFPDPFEWETYTCYRCGRRAGYCNCITF